MDIKKIDSILRDFSEKRDWEKFHSPKNLSMALSVEVSELVEIFQWLTEEQSYHLDESELENTKEEIADITIYVLNICRKLDINLEEVVLKKIEANHVKYPVIKDGELKPTE